MQFQLPVNKSCGKSSIDEWLPQYSFLILFSIRCCNKLIATLCSDGDALSAREKRKMRKQSFKTFNRFFQVGKNIELIVFLVYFYFGLRNDVADCIHSVWLQIVVHWNWMFYLRPFTIFKTLFYEFLECFFSLRHNIFREKFQEG